VRLQCGRSKILQQSIKPFKNFTMANLPFFQQFSQAGIESSASKAMKFHSFAKEWQVAINAVWALKFFTAAISIYAGANYLSNLVIGALGNFYVGWLSAITLLFLLESINATSLFKGFKFLLRRRPIVAFSALLIAMASFSLSFYVSVNGIEQMQTAKADDTGSIKKAEKKNAEQIELDYDAQINEQAKAIERIEKNPQGWQGGKRTTLTRSQLTEISEIRNNIGKLRNNKAAAVKSSQADYKAKIEANQSKAKGEGEKYYRVVAILMFVQLFANFGLTFFYAKVYTEVERQNAENEDIEQFARGLFSNMYEDVKSRYANLQHTFSRKAGDIFADVASAPISHPLTPDSENLNLPPVNTPVNTSNPQPVGFQNRNLQQTNSQCATQNQTPESTAKTANYYLTHRPQLCEAIMQQSQGEIFTTNRKLAERYGCSEATVRNCRRAIIE